jgi:hypothetical protein
VQVKALNVHLHRPEHFTLEHLAATPVASIIAAADAETRERIGSAVRMQLLPYRDGDGVTFPEETYFVTAHL